MGHKGTITPVAPPSYNLGCHLAKLVEHPSTPNRWIWVSATTRIGFKRPKRKPKRRFCQGLLPWLPETSKGGFPGRLIDTRLPGSCIAQPAFANKSDLQRTNQQVKNPTSRENLGDATSHQSFLDRREQTSESWKIVPVQCHNVFPFGWAGVSSVSHAGHVRQCKRLQVRTGCRTRKALCWVWLLRPNLTQKLCS